MDSLRCVGLVLCTLIVAALPVVADGQNAPNVGWEKAAAGPEARYGVQLVWDSHKQRVLLFGGEANPQFKFFDDLWAYDPKGNMWVEIKVNGERPVKRNYYAACFDSKRNRLWLHGGFNGNFLDDLWFFNGATNQWTPVEVKGDKPGKRDGHDLYYNAKTDELILVAGLNDFKELNVNNELWVFDCAKETWSKKAPGPSGRFLYCSAWDEAGQTLYVTGGFGKGGQPVGKELWVYAAARDKWESRDNEGLPGNFGAGRMVYLPSQKRLLLFGGGDTGREVWYDPAAKKWEPAPKDAPVPARSYHGMCTDARGERVFVLGGTTGGFTGKMVPGDLWIGSLSPGKK